MKKRTVGLACIFLTAFIFSTTELSLKSISPYFHALQLIAARFFIGGLCLLPFAWRALRKNRIRLQLRDLGYFMLLGVLFIILSMIPYQLALKYTPASAVAVLYCCNALFTTLFAGLILKEPLRKEHLFALLFELAAVLVIVSPWQNPLDPKGVFLILFAALIYALYGVAGRRRSGELGAIVITCGAVLTGSLQLFLLILLGRIPAVSAFLNGAGLSILADVPLISPIPAGILPAFLYVVFIISAGGNLLHMVAVAYTSAQEASLIFFIKPALAPVLAALLLHEPIRLNMAVGIVLFLTGSAIALRGGKKKDRASA